MTNEEYLKTKENGEALTLYKIGCNRFMAYVIDHFISAVESIKKHCVSELSGTYYEDFLKEYENTDMAQEYTPNLVYESILSWWTVRPNLFLTDDIMVFVELQASLDSNLTKFMIDFLPADCGPFNFDEEGNAHRVNITDTQVSNSLKAGETISQMLQINENIEEIRRLAEAKGSLAQIIRLTEL
jgi:hypothetical protein